jgi:predicted dehydrogenase/aryl-alcohol dehydrogenase-like predicted oxidoreductase
VKFLSDLRLLVSRFPSRYTAIIYSGDQPNMTKKLHWGIIGTGAIARTLANGISKSRTSKLVAVASRDKAKAESFGKDFEVDPAHCFGDYEEILKDGSVDAVYVATPHPLHAEWAIKAAEAGKHVLVEKPMAVNQYLAQAIIEAAVANNVFVTEAFMYRCHPQTAKLVEILKEKLIGDVRVIQATFSFGAGFNPTSRLYDPALGGGGILDIGCYPASIARLIAGAATGKDYADPIDVKAIGHLESTGVDGYTSAVVKFPGEIIATLSAGISVNQENVVRIFGTGGWIFLPNPWVANRGGPDTAKIIVHRNGEKEPTEFTCAAHVTSFTLEVDAMADAIAAGKKQGISPAMSWGDSLGNIKLLDAWRQQIKVEYDIEKPDTFPKVTAANRPLKVKAKHNMTYGSVPNLSKKVSRLIMGVDNQVTMPHAAGIFDYWIESGGNAFDTAFIYAGGWNEKLLGQWIKNRGVRNDIVIISKGGHTPHCNPKSIREQFLISLERMQIDHADLYMMHRDNPDIPAGEFVDVLNEFVKEKRLTAFGGSNWSIDRVQAANDYAKAKGLQGFSIVSNNFSLARMVAPVWGGCISASDPASRAWLTKTQLALFPWSSQARGFFTDRAHRDQSLNDEEMNRCWYSDDNWQRRDRVLELAKKKNVLPINIALAYVLNQPFPTFPLIGPRTLEELRTSLPGLDISLTADEVKWLNLEA